jgi:hypothetical protein
MRRIVQSVLIGFLIVTPTVDAQVRQAMPEDSAAAKGDASTGIEVKSPMLIDIPLGEGIGPNGKARKALNATPAGVTRAYSDAAKYVCDKARVGVILLQREEKHGSQHLKVSPSLSTGWMRQDVNVKVSLLSEGREIRSTTFDRLTIGGSSKGSTALGVFAFGIGTSRAKAPSAEWDFRMAEWDALWKPKDPPTLRVVVEIVQ